ncbi:MAG: hypothetical protein CMD96_03515 [Gammaproteobacteria bacterium]|jgi:hypothetical protein|nr:hypothetical protein [Gammaproteobacteria bacterium]HJP19090.1 tail fiber domain-containing protein [Nitrospinota bacterium]
MNRLSAKLLIIFSITFVFLFAGWGGISLNDNPVLSSMAYAADDDDKKKRKKKKKKGKGIPQQIAKLNRKIGDLQSQINEMEPTPGSEGPEGPQGPQGETGPQGPEGPKGDTGEQGPQGIAGPTGPTGPQGPAGPQGLAGADGAVGSEGPKGDKGEQGIQGEQGLQGIAGADGATGPKGDTGEQGSQGIAGLPGADGAQGPQGEQGIQGIAGLDGADGATGPQGPQGEQGIEGPKGDKGDQGIQGLAGPAGADGAAGPQGDQGVQGVAGPAGSAGADGTDGAQGPKGDTGDQGPQGVAGLAGADGAIGPVGPAGSAGADGAQGPQGLQGDKGDQGIQGLAGTAGADGATGPQGLQGEQGLQGPQGLPGEKGDKGDQGIQGVAGPAGPTGADGTDGAVGPQGPQGIAGLDGADGATGPQGLQGEQGIQGLAGPAGPAGADGTDGAQGPKGDTGDQGPQGVAGLDGADGAQGLQGEQGIQGLPGPQGPQGIAGLNGAVGPQGTAGLDGIDGADGAQGPQGIAGAMGLQGPAGPAGAEGPQGPQGEQGPAGPFESDGSDTYFTQGNVGLGTTSPEEKLHVEGNAKITGTLHVGANSLVLTEDEIIFSDGSIQSTAAKSIIDSADGVYITGAMQTTYNGQDAIEINGINLHQGVDPVIMFGGTSLTVLSLDFVGDTYDSVLGTIPGGDPIGEVIFVEHPDSTPGSFPLSLSNSQGDSHLDITVTAPDNPILDNPTSSVWELNGLKTYYNQGNVGIGTSNPLSTLTVVGDGNGSQLRLGAGDQDKILVLGYEDAGGGYGKIAAHLQGVGPKPLSLQASGVGIGISLPAAMLDVAGDVAINGTTVIDSNGQWVGDPTGLQGPAGPAGGPEGPAGPAGPQGPEGPQGPVAYIGTGDEMDSADGVYITGAMETTYEGQDAIEIMGVNLHDGNEPIIVFGEIPLTVLSMDFVGDTYDSVLGTIPGGDPIGEQVIVELPPTIPGSFLLSLSNSQGESQLDMAVSDWDTNFGVQPYTYPNPVIHTFDDVAIGRSEYSGHTLWVEGSAYATGAAGALSDIRHKKNVRSITDSALSIMANLRPVTYEWKKPVDSGMEGTQIGFVAQEVEKVLPDAVLTQDDEEQTKGLKYNEFIPLMVKAIQELKTENESARADNASLKEELVKLEVLKTENTQLKEAISAIVARQGLLEAMINDNSSSPKANLVKLDTEQP